uniref:Uncharacterized protein n=1 Tax=Romanomermis culicivorax TaxID=13658 RepID=A0A915IW61_ROMCU
MEDCLATYPQIKVTTAILFIIFKINSQNIQQSDLEKIIQENLHGDARYRTNYKLIALLIGDLVKNEKSVQERQRVKNCIALSTSRKIYGRCVESLIEKQYKDLTRRRRKFLSSNHHRRKKSIIDGDNNQVTWSSMFDHISEFLYHVIKSAKSTIGGSWFSSSNDTQTQILDDQVPDDPNINTNQTANDVINLINQLLNSPLVAMKQNLSFDQIFQNPDHQKNNLRILSPRLFPLFESKSNAADSFLSPDILALYDDRSSSNTFHEIL